MTETSVISSATAWEAWDSRWRSPEGRSHWLKPEPEVEAFVIELERRGARAVLDLGCGIGRHAIHLAHAGLEVSAMDAAPAGLDHLRAWAEREHLSVDSTLGQMTELPYENARFDAVLAWNVIYHGEPGIVARVLDEVRRVLRPCGLFLCTFLSLRHIRYGEGREVARDTFVIDDIEERNHPHHYCNAAGVLAFLRGFEPWSLVDRPHEGPDTYHWHVLAERLTP